MKPGLSLLKQSIQCRVLQRNFSSGQIIFNKPTPTKPTSTPVASSLKLNNVHGLSEAIVGANEPVGPGASRTGEYKVPEYFNYNAMSVFEAEVELAKYRCPQPNANRKS